MKQNLIFSIALLIAAITMQSCASTVAIDARWKNPDVEAVKPAKVLVIVIGETMRARQIAEDAFETALTAQGFNAIGAFETLPVASGTLDSSQVLAVIQDLNCQAVLTARMVDENTEQHWVPGTTSMPMYYGSYGGYYGRYGYYGGGYSSSPGYMDETTTVLLESNLYNTGNGLVWVGQSSVIVSGNTEKLIAKYAAVVVKGMMDDGVLLK